MKMMIVGDTHGNAKYLNDKVHAAKEFGVQILFVVGDFGLWPGVGGVEFLDDVNDIMRKNDMSLFALPGNHENHTLWKQFINSDLPTSKHCVYVRSRVLLSPKVNQWRWAGKQFFVAGGAVSIDKQWRTLNKNWWADEEFEQGDLDSVLKYKGRPVDYLLTHDCSDFTPWKSRLKPDLDSLANRQRIDKAIAHLKPRFHFHGHMHEFYDWENTQSHGRRPSAFGADEENWNGATTRTIGLECNNSEFSWVILDTDTDEILHLPTFRK